MTSAPLSLLPYQTGLVVTPLEETGAKGQSTLDTKQRAIVIGEPVPIVFGRRIDGIGGVFVSPGATEGKFQNSAIDNDLFVYWQLVLSEGELPQVQIRDLFRGGCRKGFWEQAYNARADDWVPGTALFAVSTPGTTPWVLPQYCGNGGTYENLTMLSYSATSPDGDNSWDQQVHVFVREGMQVTRILDNTYGPSNNVVDLALYLIRETSRFPEAMIDLVAMEAAARFTNANGLFYNGIFQESTNLEDWLQQTASSFLLRLVDRNGKKGFRPRLPANSNGTINTDAIPWVFTFTEDHIAPNGFDISYISLAERKPIAAQMLWRQQPEDDIGLIRTTDVRFTGEAADGPFEQYDLSVFCASENHAVKVGAYYVARRKFIEHTLRLRVRPAAFNSTIAQGDIVRVLLKRENINGVVTEHNYLYEVERIGRDISGSVELDLTHFPVNEFGQSIVALYVNEAVGSGYVLDVGRADYDCDDAGRRTDTTPIDLNPYTNPSLPPAGSFDYDLPEPSGDRVPATPGGGFNPGDEPENPSDPLDDDIVPEIQGASGPDGQPVLNDVLTLPDICPGMKTEWFLQPANGGLPFMVSSGVAQNYLIGPEATGFSVIGRGCCPDPGAPEGFATCQQAEPTPVADGGELAVPGAELTDLFNWEFVVNGQPTNGFVGGPVVRFFLEGPFRFTAGTEPPLEGEDGFYQIVAQTNNGSGVMQAFPTPFTARFKLADIPAFVLTYVEIGDVSNQGSYSPPEDWLDQYQDD